MTDFRNVASVGDFEDGGRKVVEINDHEILVINLDDDFRAVENVCTCVTPVVGHKQDHTAADPHTHGGRLARLSEAEVADGKITCPMHESVFDLETGKPVSGFAEIPLNTYEVRLEGDQVQVAELPDAERHFWNDPGSENRP